ncbi:MAG: tartrate dehydrogenase [Gammaproteobacteria bacterium]|nr:tartrate dehydrogenase [Gammaproteobacteria bacterium]
MVASYRIAVIAGDGIGREMMPEGIRVLDAAAARFGFRLQWDHKDWSCEQYAKEGQFVPADGIERLRECDAIYFGAIGYSGVPNHVPLRGLLLPLQREFDHYVHVRPVRWMPGAPSPLAKRRPDEVDLVIVRKNIDAELMATNSNTNDATRLDTDRVLRYAFELAQVRRSHVTAVTNANGLTPTLPQWDERFAAMAAQYTSVRTAKHHAHTLATQFVRNPHWFDVVVTADRYGHFISDLAPACAGLVTLAPSAHLNPEHRYPSLFESGQGPTADIAGKGIANPISHIWAGAMMLEHIGETDAADAVLQAIKNTLRKGPRPYEFGGTATTEDIGRAVEGAMQQMTSAAMSRLHDEPLNGAITM